MGYCVHSYHNNNKITRMTTFIKAMLKKSDDQTNIDKYRVVANISDATASAATKQGSFKSKMSVVVSRKQ